jgi:hypothetical protein
MLNITYAATDAHTAEQMQQDLSQAGLRLDNPMLIVLVTPDSIADASMQADIAQAKQAGNIIAPVILRQASLPDNLKGEISLDLSKKYDKNKLIAFVKRSDITKERVAKNRRLLFYVGGAALLMFVISIISIAKGIVAFPVDEYATENAIRDAQIATLVAPDIEMVRPRTTEDALNFESTLDAVQNEDLLPFIIGTATAIPEQFHATNEARMTQAFGTESAQTQAAEE